MANKIFQGENLALAGTLKDNNVVTTAYTVVCQILSKTQSLIREVPMTVDAQTSKYICAIDTSDLLGSVIFRFVAKTQNGDKIVSNEDIIKVIYK